MVTYEPLQVKGSKPMSYTNQADAQRALTRTITTIRKRGGEESFNRTYSISGEWHYEVEAWAGGRWAAYLTCCGSCTARHPMGSPGWVMSRACAFDAIEQYSR